MSMIKRDETPATPPLPAAALSAAPAPTSSDLLLGAGAEFEGKRKLRGTVRSDAILKGQIDTNDVLVVGEHARIDAEINCGTVVVDGEVNGNIHAKTGVELHRAARVKGNIETPSFALERGARLQGAVKMGSGGAASK